MYNFAVRVHQVEVVDVIGPPDFVNQVADGVHSGQLRHHSRPGTRFECIDQRQRLAMYGLLGGVSFPFQVPDGGDADENKQEQYDDQDGNGGQIELSTRHDIHGG